MSVNTLDKNHEKTYTRKVSQVGNSLSFNIPKDLVDLLNITKGEELQITYNQEEGGIMVKKANRVPEGIRPEMLKAMNRAVGKYDEALRNLKDR
ncbi:AbrB/MazE/SpoVT family DNA-binding domain-containing protein [Halobacillus locisalis]|uniref:AbrB/MazE/SpoVT family DNA-binding domain-containing protein n=1 Tax=Halobacillus locisalis TaxID=220753 RepID=A0A838CYE3_9BACI|nr:AbrB/MazE/SpoVT family DNA-binding domain-containing protein [Halobacillus locisalis]MBA2176849.1 AbrB/MazE/SpoVT family DNA-binding domain-containing protein [Halobacillus locisalis]